MQYNYRGHGIQVGSYGIRVWYKGRLLVEVATEKEAREWIDYRLDN